LSFVARIAELPLMDIPAYKSKQSYDISHFGTAAYFILMTITTVGYGDLSPHTTEGRIVAIAAALWGSTLVSLLVVT